MTVKATTRNAESHLLAVQVPKIIWDALNAEMQKSGLNRAAQTRLALKEYYKLGDLFPDAIEPPKLAINCHEGLSTSK
jgi:hypothetical protein